jgi:hypothetical protein
MLSSDSSGSSWSTASSRFPDPKEKAHGLQNKTELLSCEETEGNKSTSLDNISIHLLTTFLSITMHFASREASSFTYPIFQHRIQGEGRRLNQMIGNSSRRTE